MTSVIHVKNLKKSYHTLQAVDGISFDVEKGTIFGLLGHNGAGKSTTIECMLGTKKIDSGEISILGQNPCKNRKQLFQRVGVQLQNSAYQDRIKVKELCEMNHSLYQNAQNWKTMLKQFGLSEKTNSFVSDLSGGEQQKLFIILAVMHRPELIFLDELTTGLDPKARRDVWKLIRSLRDNGMTVFLTSHYMDEVAFLCDRAAILKAGKIIVTGTVPEIIAKSGTQTMDDAFLYFAEEETI